MSSEEEPTVFTRLRDALADAQEEEEAFATEVTTDDPASEALYRAFSQWAEDTFSSARSLRLTPKATRLLKDDIGRAVGEASTVREVAQLPFVKPPLHLHLARFGVDRVETGAKRLYNVLDCLLEADLPPFAESYLTSVAQLYLLGFNNEAVVMARSALEAALESAVTRGREDNQVRDAPPQEPNLSERIRAAGPTGMRLLDGTGVRDAHDIRQAGNDAVHVNLGTQKLKALDAVRALHRILRQLFPTADPSVGPRPPAG